MTKFRKTIAGLLLASALTIGGFASGVIPAIAQSVGVIIQAQNGLANAPSIYGVSDSTSGLYFATGKAGFTKHVAAGSTATANLPVLSACGTSPALMTGSTDHAGKITVGTSASAGCTLTFGTAYAAEPICIYQNNTTAGVANVVTVAAATIAWSSVLADSTVLEYICIGRGG